MEHHIDSRQAFRQDSQCIIQIQREVALLATANTQHLHTGLAQLSSQFSAQRRPRANHCHGLHAGTTSISNPTHKSGKSMPTRSIACRLACMSGRVFKTPRGSGLR